VTTQEREVTTSDRASFPLPITPDGLAKYAAQDLLLLDSVQQHAPQEISEAIAHVGLTIQRLAMYAFAMSQETPPDVSVRIAKRVDSFQQKVNGISKEQGQWSGALLNSIFTDGYSKQ
jgi:hypothetical protein